jgi:hypothetical protein
MEPHQMPDFAFFTTVDGEPVAVHVDQVIYVRPRIDGNGILIAFAGDDGVGVRGTMQEVVASLKAGSTNVPD